MPASLKGGGEVAFLVVAAAPVVALLAVPIPVLDDAGLHLASAAALQYTLTGQFGDVLTWRPGLPPNLTAEIVLLGLLQLLAPVWALKALIAAIVLGFAFAARRLVTAAGAAAPWAVLLLPFAWHRMLALGFLGFSAAVVLAMLAVALVLDRPARPPVPALAVLLTVTWFTHLIPALVAVGVCLAVVVTEYVATRGKGGAASPLVAVAPASAPAVVLTVVSLVLSPPAAPSPQPGSAVHRIADVLGMFWPDVSLVRAEYVLYGIVALALYVAAAAVLLVRLRPPRRLRAVDGLLVSAVLGDVAAAVAPEGVSGAGGFLGPRVALFPPLLLAVWVAAHVGAASSPAPRRARGRVALAVVSAAVALLLVGVRLPAQLGYSAAVTDTLGLARCLPERSTVLQIDLDDVGADAAQAYPLSHQVGFLAAERRSVDVGNESGWVPYYLWRFREGQSVDRVLATEPYGASSYPPRVDLAGALGRGERLDAVLLVGRAAATPEVLGDGPTRQMLADLDAHYERVATSSRGTTELWLRTGVPAACGT